MRQIIYWLQQFDRKTLLFVAAALLLILNVGRMAYGYYQEQLEEAESKRDLLAQYTTSIEKLPELKSRISRLEQRASSLEKYLFKGATFDEVSSSVQIMLQKMLTSAGLTPESIQPIRSGRADEDESEYDQMMIKMRLSGGLPEYIDFYSRMYNSGKLFLIESLTLTSYKEETLKSYIVIKVYYNLKS